MRRLWALLLTPLDRRHGWAGCASCGISWRRMPGHAVVYDYEVFGEFDSHYSLAEHAVFWLCEWCWEHSTVERRLWLGQERHGDHDYWPAVAQAVLLEAWEGDE